MVPKFLNSKDNSMKYAESLKLNSDAYNPFNLVFYERNKCVSNYNLNNFLI